MRLLETVRMPIQPRILPAYGPFTAGKYAVRYTNSGLQSIQDYSIRVGGAGLILYDLGPPEKGSKTFVVIFGQPKLGRVWNVEKLSIALDSVTSFLAQDPGVQSAINFQAFLNGVSVGPMASAVYDVPIGAGTLTDQNSPLPYQFFSSLTVSSGDTFSLEVSTGINKQLSVSEAMDFYFKLTLQLIGENVSA